MAFKDKEKARAKCREYYYKNRERLKKQMKEYGKEWYKRNKERLQEHRNKPQNKERKNKYMNRYRKNNKGKIKLSNKIQYENNKENRINYSKEYNRNNKERRNERERERKKIEPSFLIQCRLTKQLWVILNRYSKTGKANTSKVYGINWNEIIQELKPFPENIQDYQVDHIIPLSWFNFNNPKEIRWAFAPENHQWLTKEENLNKGNRYIMVAERKINND